MDDVVTDRLVLATPTAGDRDELFELYRDPAVWAADPLTRHDDPRQSAAMIERWRSGRARDGLGTWVARDAASGDLVGVGGAFVRGDVAWNLGFRLVPARWGHGYAVEIIGAALPVARRLRPELPITAYLVEGNDRSRATVERLGLRLVWRGPDAGNPDPAAVRLVFADRDLDDAVVAVLTRG